MKKITSKKCIALVLAITMIITSVPLMMVSAVSTGSYDPAPYWGDGSEYSAINTNFIATFNTDGSVEILFPDAVPQKTYDGSATKTIESYVFTLTKITEEGETEEVIYTENLDADAIRTGSGEYPNHIYYGPGGLESLKGYDVQSTYDVAIHAVDSDGWFSDKIHTLLSDVPYYNMTADFSPNETWVAREMLLFESKGGAEIDGESQGDGNDSIDYKIHSGSGVNVDGPFAEMGYEGNSYHFWVNSAYSTPFSITTTWSRTHYDFTNAQEAWFYVDFSRVDFTQVAFTLTANEKRYVHWKSGSENKTWSRYGDLFSTKAVGTTDGVYNYGTKGGIYIQNADGLWEETTMTNGYLTDLAGYKGFVRIPIDYFLLQIDQYINARNTVSTDWTKSEAGLTTYADSLLFRQDGSSGIILELEDGTKRTSIAVTKTFDTNDSTENKDVYQVLVNPKGTSVTDALIIYDRFEKFEQFEWSSFSTVEYTRGTGKQLHTGTTVTETTNADGTITYKVTDGVKAIEDLCSAGIEVAGWSNESIAKAFEIDQVMFCQKAEGDNFDANGYVTESSSVKFPQEGSTVNESGTADLGRKVANFYDRTEKVPEAIANYILEYVGKIPSLEDANAIKIIDSIITTYIDCFPGCSTVDEAITYMGNTAGHTEAYNRYINAQAFLINYFNADDETRNQKAVEAFEKKVELLDDPDYADYNDEKLKVQLNDLMALYKSFNLSHFEILGEAEKDKFITLYNIMIGEEVKTGYSIGAYPFIPFNDFETNYKVGQLSDIYYDNVGYVGDKTKDINNVGNFTTFVSKEFVNTASILSSSIGWHVQTYSPTAKRAGTLGISEDAHINDTSYSNANGLYSRMDAIISNKGFADSLGATLRINGDLNSSSDAKFATLSTTYKGQDLYNSGGTFAQLQGLDLSALAVKTDTSNGTDAEDTTRYGGAIPNSFVMYVDFTEIVDQVDMTIKFILDNGSGEDFQAYFCGGGINDSVIFYILNDAGEWEAKTLTATYLDQNNPFFDNESKKGLCSIGHSDLVGYKGFVRIPLSNFRVSKGGSSLQYFDNMLDDGYTIKHVKLSFWDYTGNNVGTNINVDAMGFTFDPDCTTRAYHTTQDSLVNELNSDNGLSKTDGTNIKNMDEYFAVKTNDSVNFEKMVAEIDPYEGKEAFLNAYNEAKTAYDNLSFYQKGLDEIKHSYNDVLIGKYQALAYESGRSYETLMAQEPWVAKYTDTASLIADIDALSDTVKNYNVSGTNILDFYDSSEGGQVNYSALGIEDETQAIEIIEMYEKGYCRLSSTNKALIDPANKTALENAYNAAKRAELIKGYVEDMTQFKQSIVTIYTDEASAEAKAGTDLTYKEPNERMVEYDDADLKKALDSYDSMSVFAKQILVSTNDPAVAGYTNMHAAAESIYDNSVTINLGTQDGISGTLSGGIIIHENKLNSYVEPLRQKLANRELLNVPDDTFLQEIEYYLGQTESFLQRYAKVREINEAYHALADQLAVADITSLDADGNALSTIYLDNDDATSATAKIDLTYIATRLNKNVVLYVQSDLTWTQTEGPAYEAFKYYSYYDTKGSEEAGLITAPINNNYTNGNSSTISPYEYTISVDATEAAKVTNGAVYNDTITFYAVDPEVLAAKIAEDENDKYATAADVFADGLCILEKVDVDVVFESTNGADPLSYTVSIPAIPDVQWNNNNPIDVSYTIVNANLGSQKLLVTVSNDGLRNDDDTAFVMTNDDTGTTYTLDYTTQNFGTEEFTGTITTETKPTNQPTMTITGWDKAPYGVYDTTLTYTASVN